MIGKEEIEHGLLKKLYGCMAHSVATFSKAHAVL
jgi:hypothetical protein